MKILAICGSPRAGNTELMLKTILESAKKAGAQTKLVLLRKLKIAHCDGCMKCFAPIATCHIKDDMRLIYKKIAQANILVLGSPSYYSNVTGLMKDFIDRTSPYSVSPMINQFRNKKVVLVCVGAGTQGLDEVLRAMKHFADFFSWRIIAKIKAKANMPQEVKKDKKAMGECVEIGKRIVKK